MDPDSWFGLPISSLYDEVELMSKITGGEFETRVEDEDVVYRSISRKVGILVGARMWKTLDRLG